MAVIVQQRARQVTPGKVMYYPEAAGQTFKAGEFVYLVSGKVTVVPATYQTQAKILGMVMQDATGVTDTALAVAIAEEGVIFEVNVYHTTPASAVTAITQVGVTYGMIPVSNKSYLNMENTVPGVFKVKRLSPKDAVGDRYGRVEVEVLGSRCQLSGQTS